MDAVPQVIVGVVIAVLAIIVVLRTVWIVPQARAQNVERFGRYLRTLEAGLHFVIPFVDKVRPRIDLREQVVSFEPQPVITEDNLVVRIDTVLYFQVTDPRAAAYEIANYIQAIEQLTVTTLRNVIGAMDLEECLTSREKINSQLRIVLDEASGKWGIRVNRVEIKAIDPPPSIKEAMEKQMRAERDKRAAILNAEGVRQSKILTAEGEKQSAILNSEGARQSAILRADGEAQAIDRVFTAIHRNDPDPKLLAYQYLQVLPELAKGEGNTFWVIPSEVTNALQGVSRAFAKDTGESAGPKVPPDESAAEELGDGSGPAALEAPRDRAAEVAKAAEEAAAEANEEAEKAKADGRDARP
jgi:regulator of protease activity HflC (stomatin/prohibitin superfamily)